MNRRTAQASLFGVALLLGMLLVMQLRSQERQTELSSLSPQELSTLIETLSAGNSELRAGLTNLREQLREYRIAEEQGESALEVTREDLRRITAFGGLLPVEGQGVELRVSGSLDAIALNDLIYELRNAGAEAIAVDEVRVHAGSVAVQGPRALEMDGVDIGRTFTIRAVGDPDGLLAAMERPGGIISQLQLFVSAVIEVQQVERLSVPATTRDLAPRVAEQAG
jgi:uncharacterized protein YlxW (UPF0749 family)